MHVQLLLTQHVLANAALMLLQCRACLESIDAFVLNPEQSCIQAKRTLGLLALIWSLNRRTQTDLLSQKHGLVDALHVAPVLLSNLMDGGLCQKGTGFLYVFL